MRPPLLLLIGLALGVTPALAYIDMPAEKLTVPRLLLEFRSAGVYRIDRIDMERGAVRYELIETLQGFARPTVRHVIRMGGKVPPALQKLDVGRRVVLLADDPYGRGVAYVEDAWYVTTFDMSADWWRIGYTDAHYDLNRAFSGTVDQLAEGCRALLAGDEATLPTRKRGEAKVQYARYTLRRPHEKILLDHPPAATRPATARSGATRPTTRAFAAAEVADLLKRLSSDPDPFARRAAAVALGYVKDPPPEVIPALLRVMRHGYENARDLVSTEATAAIYRIDAGAVGTAQFVATALKDKDPSVRRHAADIPGLLGPFARSATASLIAALRDADASVRYAATGSLRRISADPVVAAPAIAKLLRDPDRDVHHMVHEALIAMAPESVPYLTVALGRDNPSTTRRLAARILAEIGPKAQTAIPALETAASSDPDKDVKKAAADALSRVRPDKGK